MAFISYMEQGKKLFKSAEELDNLIAQYFLYIEGEHRPEEKQIKDKGNAVVLKPGGRESEPATIAGLAFHLGFNSRHAFELYETKGRFAKILQRARLRIEAGYEKKLHYQSSTGAIFALKSMGWNERTDNKHIDEVANTVFKIEIIQSGPQTASSEQEVIL